MISIYDTGSYRMTMLSYNVEEHSFALFNFFFFQMLMQNGLGNGDGGDHILTARQINKYFCFDSSSIGKELQDTRL